VPVGNWKCCGRWCAIGGARDRVVITAFGEDDWLAIADDLLKIDLVREDNGRHLASRVGMEIALVHAAAQVA